MEAGRLPRALALAPVGARPGRAARVAVSFVISSGDSIVDLIGGNPPPADVFDVRRWSSPRARSASPSQPAARRPHHRLGDRRRRHRPLRARRPATLRRPRSSTIVVAYDWVEDEPLAVGVTSSTGIETVHEIAAAVETPQPSARGFAGYALLGRSSASSRSRWGCSGCRRCAGPTRAGWRRSWRSRPVCSRSSPSRRSPRRSSSRRRSRCARRRRPGAARGRAERARDDVPVRATLPAAVRA